MVEKSRGETDGDRKVCLTVKRNLGLDAGGFVRMERSALLVEDARG
jgi:hypothetical protein